MLTNLRIENFAIVKQLDLDFDQGMTAFTGETGAGKSIMIDALMLALGARADASVIRSGEKKCDITASFLIDEGSEPASWLIHHDVLAGAGEIILRRILYQEGRSKSTINGQPFPLQKIKELSEKLVHIHGQHQHQTLLHHQSHREQLDNFANHESLLTEVQQLYTQCTRLKKDIQQLQHNGVQSDRIELLTFQIDEITLLNLQDNEIESLHKEHQLLHHAKDYLLQAQQMLALLNGDSDFNLTQGLNQLVQLFQHLPPTNKSLINARELISSALIQCEEAIHEIQHFSEQTHLDPERLQGIESRMSQIHTMARKYHIDSHQLPSFCKQLEDELTTLRHQDQSLQDLLETYQKQKDAYQKAAAALRESRQFSARKLAAEISSHIEQLGMPKGYVNVEFTILEKMHSHGLDKVEYKVCTNPGMAPDSLAKIASGGELSRIGLAIQMITAQHGATPTLLFDEVDVGIGGATAALIGQLLRKLGLRLQVFAVTHQPQVASCAHHHFVVEKESSHGQTFSRIIPLKENEKVNEVARMLGGLTITDQTRSHAKELIDQSISS